MNFDLTEDQQTIRRTAREFLAARYRSEEMRRLAEDERGFTEDQWEELAGLGWPGIFVAEEHGGQGLGMVELVILQEELGYALAPTPLLSTVAAELLIGAGGSEAQRAEWLAPLAAGERRGALALVDAGGRAPGEASLESDGSLCSGVKLAVADAASADVLVVAGSQGRHYLVDPGAAGVTIAPAPGLDPTRKLFTVELDGAEAHELVGGDGAAMARAHDAIATALAAESVGIAQRTMEMAVQHAKERRQFGTPIGGFQAVSHRCAQMLLETEGARSTTLYAAWALDHEPETAPLAAAMAKAYASDAGWRVAASALQVLGGIGFTWEHDLHFFLKRARANAQAHGDARFHRARVADLAGV